MAKAEAKLVLESWQRPDATSPAPKMVTCYRVKSMSNTVRWTIGQELTREEVADIIDHNFANVNIVGRND